MVVFLFTLGIVLICAALLGIGLLLKSKRPFKCKRCSTPEKDCKVCKKDNAKP